MNSPLARAMLITLGIALMAVVSVYAESGRNFVKAHGVRFAADVPIGEEQVPLRGTHKLRYWMFDVYAAAFYVPEGKTSDKDALAAETPRKLVLHYYRKVKASDIRKATMEALKKNPKLDRAALSERFEKLYDCYSTVKKGDEYHIIYDPAKEATQIVLNGELQCTIEGSDFARAFFGIWVSDYSLSEKMTRNLKGL